MTDESEDRPGLDAARLRARLPDFWGDVRVLARTESTNADAAALARSGAPEGTAVAAEEQRAGRGRLDRIWTVPPRSSVLVSAVLRPPAIPAPRWPWLSVVTALAVDEVLRARGVDSVLKWPNDVLARGRKITGISLERIEGTGGAAAVVGIGVNVHQRASELPVATATSLALESVAAVDRTELLAELLDALASRYRAWAAAGGEARAVRAEYLSRCDTIGRTVRVLLPDGSVARGLASDVDEHGRLVVGNVAFSVGDVTHVRAEA